MMLEMGFVLSTRTGPLLRLYVLRAAVPCSRVKELPAGATPTVTCTSVCLKLTAKDCWTCGAGWKLALPAWLALITHVPDQVKETTPPLIVQTEEADASIVKTTGKPEVAVAVGV